MRSFVYKSLYQKKAFCCALFSFCFSLSILIFPRASFASEPDWYGSLAVNFIKAPDSQSLAGGAVYTESSYENSYGGNGAIGYEFGNGFRVEGEIGYDKLEMDQVDIPAFVMVFPANGWLKRWLGLANIYYDLDTGTEWMPYIGIGAGVANQHTKGRLPSLGGTKLDDSDTIFAYQMSAGVNYIVSPSTSLFVGYRYLGLDKMTVVDVVPQVTDVYRTYNHNLQLGVRLYF